MNKYEKWKKGRTKVTWGPLKGEYFEADGEVSMAERYSSQDESHLLHDWLNSASTVIARTNSTAMLVLTTERIEVPYE